MTRKSPRRTFDAAIFLVAFALLLIVPPVAAQVAPGDIVVADFEAGPNAKGVLFLIDRVSGARTVLSDFGDPAQGPTGQGPIDIAIRDAGSILAIDNQAASGLGALYSVDPASGLRTILSDFADAAQGPLGVDPVAVAFATGFVAVVDDDAGSSLKGALFRIDPTTGDRTVLSDFGDPAQGALGENPIEIALGVNGSILVIDTDAGTDGKGVLFRIDPASGQRILLSDFGDAIQGPTGVNPGGVVLGANGMALVCDTEAGTGAAGALFNVNLLTGVRTILSDFGNLAKGPGGVDPFHVALSATGQILVVDGNGGTDLPADPGGNGALFAVLSTNGNRTVLSDFGNVTQGETGVEPSGVAIVPLTPPGAALVTSPFSGTGGSGELISIDLTTGARTVVSDFGVAGQGATGFNPTDLTLGRGGEVWVVDANVNGSGALFRVNPIDGFRSIVSAFGNAAQGPTAFLPDGVVLEPDGNLLITTGSGGTGQRGALMRVDPETGTRTLISDFGDPGSGPVGLVPESVELGAPGEVLVVDPDTPSPAAGTNSGMVSSVDLATGVRTSVSDFGDVTQGPLGHDPIDLALEPGGSILVTDYTSALVSPSVGALFRVDRATGARTVLSDFGDSGKGPLGRQPYAVLLEPSGTILVLDSSGLTSAGSLLFRVDPVTGMRTVVSDFSNATQGPTGARGRGLTLYSDSGCVSAAGCDDSVACTQDSCDLLLGCRNIAPLPPPEVQNLSLAGTANPTEALLTWDAATGAQAYNIWRGTAADLSDIACLVDGVATTSTTDDALAPPAGAVFYYLVTAANCSGESILGRRSDGSLRTSPASCP